MKRIAALLAAVALFVLTGCESNQDRDDRRYHDCIAAGGSWWADDGNVKWSCTLPGAPS